MDKVDACVESILKNLGSLVRGSRLSEDGAGGDKTTETNTDQLLEVVASQLVDNTRELFVFISELQKSLEIGDYEKIHSLCRERQKELREAKDGANVKLDEMRDEMRRLLQELEASYYGS
jgi:hypothetical protein